VEDTYLYPHAQHLWQKKHMAIGDKYLFGNVRWRPRGEARAVPDAPVSFKAL
jgi:hypothetical protein